MTAMEVRSVGDAAEAQSPSLHATKAPGLAWPVEVYAAGLVLVTLLLTAVAYGTGAELLRSTTVAVVLLFGVGSAPLQLSRRTSPASFLAGGLLLSLCVLLLLGLVMAAVPWWHPNLAFAALASGSGLLHLVGIVRQVRRRRGFATQRPSELLLAPTRITRATTVPCARAAGNQLRSGASLSTALSASGTALWLSAALTHRHIDPSFGGFVTQMPPTWFAGLVLLLAGLVTARRNREFDIALAVVLLAFALTVTPSLVYDGPRSTSAAKHVGMIEAIRHEHQLFTSPPIYHAWSGFFAAMAWLCDVAGIKDPMRLAMWWPPVMMVYRLTMLRFLGGQILAPIRYCWIAVALAVLADPLGADYFSPQAVGFVMGLGVFAFAITTRMPGRHSRAVWLVAIAGIALAPTHQLSPYIVGLTLAVLVAFGLVRPWWFPALILTPAAGWTALHWSIVKDRLPLGRFGDPTNFRPPVTVGTPGLHRLPIVQETSLALALGVLIVAIAAGLVLLREHKRQLWGLGFASATGAPIIAVSAYGNEAIFRATIFAIPWLATLGTGAFAASRRPAGRRLRSVHRPKAATPGGHAPPVRRLTLSVVCLTLLGTFLCAAFGMDSSNIIRPGDLAATRIFERTAPTGSLLLVLGEGNLPGASTYRHDKVGYLNRTKLGLPIGARTFSSPAAEVLALTERLRAYAPTLPVTDLYAIWSPTTSYFDWEYAIQKPAAFATLGEAMLASPYWQVAQSEGGTVLFQMVRAPTRKHA